MLMPNRTKYRRPHRLSYEGRAKAGRELAFGQYGLVADEGAYVSSNQLEAARVAMTRYMNRGGKVWIKVFPQLSKTAKPLGVRQGSGKGAPVGWCAPIKPGRILYEVKGVPYDLAVQALTLAAHKLPVKTIIVTREGF